MLQAGARFDGRAFYAFTAQHLPAYAAPLFVRLPKEADVTGTFKLRKVDLQREGYDPRHGEGSLVSCATSRPARTSH